LLGLMSKRKCDVELRGGKEVLSQVSNDGKKCLTLYIVYSCAESQLEGKIAPRDLHIRELRLKVNYVKHLYN